jgi:hypothetical protein
MSFDNTLSLTLTESFTLTSFEIVKVVLTPNVSASIAITITASNGKLYNRVAFLEGDAYLAWQTDSYLYTYIQSNISTIFG